MNINCTPLHPGFPQKVWVIVEQPRNEPYRLSYDSLSQTFSRSSYKSLTFERGFSGAYGWIGGTGIPPAPHHDVLLLTKQSPDAGQILLGYICGVFLRQDNDHKFVAVDDEIMHAMIQVDLPFVGEVFHHELLKLYPRVGEGEGWFGREIAFTHLLKKSLHD